MDQTKLTLGTVQLGLKYGIANQTGMPHKKEAMDILHYAVVNNVEGFDTAPLYGNSEELIGQFVKEQTELSNKLPLVFSKLPSLPNDEHASYPALLQEVKKHVSLSLNKLAIQSLDGYYLHDEKNLYSHDGKIIDCLLTLKQQGLIKNIGVSVYSIKAVKKVIDAGCFDMIQIPINAFDQQLIHSGLLEDLSQQGIKIYARSVYLQGLLLMNSDKLPDHLKFAKRWIDQFQEVAYEHKLEPNKLAFCFVRDLPQIDSIVVGCETLTQLEENINMMKNPKLPASVSNQLIELFRDIPEKVTNPTLWRLEGMNK